MEPARRSVSSLLVSLILVLCALVLFVIALFMGIGAFFPYFFGGNEIDPDSTILGTVFAAEAVILIFASFFCIQKYLNQASAEIQARFHMPVWLILSLIVGSCIALAAGYFLNQSGVLTWLALPLLTLPAVLLPIYLLLGLGTNSIELGPRWRAWGIFGIGMTIGPLLLFIIELVTLILLFFILFAVIATLPDINREFLQLASQIQQAEGEPESMIGILLPYLLKPQVVFLFLLFFCGVATLVEELLKPLGLWLFAGKLESPAQRFALGALSGGAFALVETFGSIAQSMDWASLVGARVATGLMHILTTGLMGWGIAHAWRERKFLMLLLAYAGSFLIHGIWNGNIILYTLSTMAREYDATIPFGKLSPITFNIAILLSMTMLGILVFTNRKLRQIYPPAPVKNPESTLV